MTFYGFIIFGALTLKGCLAEGEWFLLAWAKRGMVRGRLHNPRPSFTPAEGRLEEAGRNRTGHDCLTAGTPDNCIDSRGRR